MHWLVETVVVANQLIIWYFLAVNSVYALLLLLSVPEIWKHWTIVTGEDLQLYMGAEALPPISVLMPAYNMQASITESVKAQLSLRYPRHEVIVINDGSTDGTLAHLRAAFDLYEVPPAFPRRIRTAPVRAYYRSRTHAALLVVDKENGGKGDALNVGINSARSPLVVAVDADTLVAPDALLRLVRPFLLGENVAAAGGTIRIANGCRISHGRIVEPLVPPHFLAAVQVPEYLRAFLFGRLGWNRLGGNLIVSGAFGLFQRHYLLAIGGYATDSVVEDLDVVVRLRTYLRRQRARYTIPFVPDPVAWTEVPSDLRTHRRQRERWHRGLITTLLGCRRMLFNPGYGALGLVTVPFFFFCEMLAPVVESFGYVVALLGWMLGLLDLRYALLFLAAALGYQLLLSVWAVVFEETTFNVYRRAGDFVRLLVYAAAEPFGYRQLTVLWRLLAFGSAVRRSRAWGEMRRRGFAPAAT